MTDDSKFVALCAASDVTPDLPFKAVLDGVDVAVFKVGDAYYVTQDACTHGPGSLCEGYVDGEEIECPFHQGKFSIITGAPTAAPCTAPLRIWKTLLRDGQVMAESDNPA